MTRGSTADSHERLTFDQAAGNPVLNDAVQEIVVDATMRMPTMATVLLHVDSPELKLSGKEIDRAFEIGGPIRIQIGQNGDGGDLFEGEITALESDFSRGGKASLLIQAYDSSFRLHRGKVSRTFLNQSDSDIIRLMASEAGLSAGTMPSPPVRHVFMMQNNQTNMEWLLMRAEQLGCQMYVTDKKLHFASADASTGGGSVKLTWGEDLLSFRPRITATHQLKEVVARSWDQLKKEAIESKVGPDGKLKSAPVNQPGGQYAASKLKDKGKAALVITNTPVQDVKAAQALAKGMAADLESEFTHAEGVCFGRADLKVGGEIEVVIREQAPTGYSGKYRLTSVRHVYRRSGRWETHFTVSGRRPTTLAGLLEGGNDRLLYSNRVNGVVPALVTNFRDPENLGRVKVKYPWLKDQKGVEIESDWVRIASPSAGKERGFYYIPEVNDEVLVAFEHGDPNRPYILGSLWNKKDPPPKPTQQVNDGANITERIIRSRSGHVIILNDSSGQEQIVIRDKSEKNEIVIDTKTNSISITAMKDINIDAGGNVNIKAKGMVSIDSGLDTKINSKAGFSMQATANSTMKSAVATIESQGPMTIKGLATEVSGTAKADLKSGGIVMVQGALIKLN